MLNKSDWLKSLKVGDEVAFGQCSHDHPRYQFSKIAKISPSGLVLSLESGEKFNVNGNERTPSFCKAHLRQPDEARKLITAYETVQNLNNKCQQIKEESIAKIEEMNLEQLEKLKTFLDRRALKHKSDRVMFATCAEVLKSRKHNHNLINNFEETMTHKPTQWMQMQTNSLQTQEDKFNWMIERLTHLQNLTTLSRGQNLTLDMTLEELDAILSEVNSGKMIDRGIVD